MPASSPHMSSLRWLAGVLLLTLATSAVPPLPRVPRNYVMNAEIVFPEGFGESLLREGYRQQVTGWALSREDRQLTKASYDNGTQTVIRVKAKTDSGVWIPIYSSTFPVNGKQECTLLQGDAGLLFDVFDLLALNVTWQFGGYQDRYNKTVSVVEIWRKSLPTALFTMFWDPASKTPVLFQVLNRRTLELTLYIISSFQPRTVLQKEFDFFNDECAGLVPEQKLDLELVAKKQFTGIIDFTPVMKPTQIPNMFDLRWLGKTVMVRNQRVCGSCWSHATATALDNAMAHLMNVSLFTSNQELIDCASKWRRKELYSNVGCFGGFPSVGLQYVLDQGGLLLANNYPYQGINAYCKAPRYEAQGSQRFGELSGYFNLVGDASVNATFRNVVKEAIMRYGGVATSYVAAPECTSSIGGLPCRSPKCLGLKNKLLNHAVVLVGWGPSYWIFQNSWGTGWGQSGYGRMDFVMDCNMAANERFDLVVPVLKGHEKGYPVDKLLDALRSPDIQKLSEQELLFGMT